MHDVDGQAPSSCTGGYAKPSWQRRSPSHDGKRDMPDIAIFAGDGTLQNFYLYCEADVDPSNAACSLTPGSGAPPYPDIQWLAALPFPRKYSLGWWRC